MPAVCSYEFKTPKPIPSFKTNVFQGLVDQESNVLPKRNSRKIDNFPFKVLDAPQLSDDFYLNLVDWSDTNNLAVGLHQQVYIWSASSS